MTPFQNFEISIFDLVWPFLTWALWPDLDIALFLVCDLYSYLTLTISTYASTSPEVESLESINPVPSARNVKMPDFELWSDLNHRRDLRLSSFRCFRCVLWRAFECRPAWLSTAISSQDSTRGGVISLLPALEGAVTALEVPSLMWNARRRLFQRYGCLAHGLFSSFFYFFVSMVFIFGLLWRFSFLDFICFRVFIVIHSVFCFIA